MTLASNLIKLHMNYSIFLIRGDNSPYIEVNNFTIDNLVEFPSIIFRGLESCIQLEMLSCHTCLLRDNVGIDYLLCGMAQGKFAKYIAALSLGRLIGTIDESYKAAVRERLPKLVFDTETVIHV